LPAAQAHGLHGLRVGILVSVHHSQRTEARCSNDDTFAPNRRRLRGVDQ
jgi:hypothetical protein